MVMTQQKYPASTARPNTTSKINIKNDCSEPNHDIALCEELFERPVQYCVWHSPKSFARPQVLKLRKMAPRTCSQALEPPFGGGLGGGGVGVGVSPFSEVFTSPGAVKYALGWEDIVLTGLSAFEVVDTG